MNRKTHWEHLYSTKGQEKVGWYKPHLRMSLELIYQTGVNKEAKIIDIGGGASTLVDDLLDYGFNHITVLDLSSTALTLTRLRLGEQAKDVEWIEGDITRVSLPESYYDVWHDRAVFHFLISPMDRKKYVEIMRRSLKPRAHIIIATFSPEAPPQCSGLNVSRYSHEQLHAELGEELELKEYREELHITPGGVKQQYIYCYFQLPA